MGWLPTHTHMQDLESYKQVEFDEVAEYCRSIKCPLVEASAKVLYPYIHHTYNIQYIYT